MCRLQQIGRGPVHQEDGSACVVVPGHDASRPPDLRRVLPGSGIDASHGAIF
jgi:hypothetical protein